MVLKTKTRTLTVDAPTRSVNRLVLADVDKSAVIESLTTFTDDELTTVSLEDDTGESAVIVDSDTELTMDIMDVRQEQGLTTATVLLVKKQPSVPQDILDKAAAYDILTGGA